jgi:hypothetical protein
VKPAALQATDVIFETVGFGFTVIVTVKVFPVHPPERGVTV